MGRRERIRRAHIRTDRLEMYLLADRRDKVDRRLRWFAEAIGTGVVLMECEPYHEDPERMFQAWAETPLGITDPAAAVFEVLRLCYCVASRCSVTGPTEYEGGAWEFGGVFESRHMLSNGIRTIGFRITNYD